ncbi:uncharacterized protein KQ657_002955 [Scheffersomyces spartinae]|uniref:HIG1 domain-containing protein n=1 Tax=Scheffersomyces spartinae TaxID=45513 RepID=A0A9P7V5G9_9ASCO|nr:uncharacterized protein KQ657_002955 [Scheffersomyces spartinae]KAG7191563.1 hypothetical protein KQ657_002955 [Scheffersomyces spartinae]
MKILTEEEKQEHTKRLIVEGLKGTVVGLAVSYGLTFALKKKFPIKYNQMNFSTKTALYVVPTAGIIALYQDDGSVKFEEEKYRGSLMQKQREELQAKWDKMTTNEKAFHMVNDNKYKIIVGAWAASLYGSWRLVNRDKYMDAAQKAVQARVYAQGITVVLLLSTILLSMYEAKLKKDEPAPIPEWKKYLDEQQALKEAKEHQN